MAEPVTLEDLFLNEVRALYDAEQRVAQAWPNLVYAASAPELKRAFEWHLAETDNHLARLDGIFGILDQNPTGRNCEAIGRLIADCDGLTNDGADGAIADVRLIASAQKVEHYEIAGYATLRTWAELLGRKEAAQLLDFTLEEERLADGALNEISRRLRVRAAAIRRE